MATVSLQKLVKRYGALEIVHGIDLEVADREFIALVGPSGCGKSTTLRMIAGLEPISGGNLKIGGRTVNDLPPRARNISMVFQSYALYPHMTVRENMGFSLKIAGMKSEEIAPRVEEAARTLDLTHLLDRRPSQLSGGQRQRVAMGRAIVRNPDVFLFDEPLSNLDAKLRTQMRTEIKKLHAKVQSTVIYVTHDQVEAMTLADRIVIMRDGHIEQVGTPEEVFQRPASKFVAGFIGSPPMNLKDAEIADGRVVFVNGDSLPLPRRFADSVTAGRKVTFGLRPDDLYPAGHGIHSGQEADVHKADLRVSITEPLGNETLVFSEHGGAEWVGRMLNPRRLRAGETLPFCFDLSQAHLFDRETGRTLRG
ncbi:ABC transporter ATP-binding protein [Ensifer aridi]|uniref:ABC transporter ATP-binding protein n=1 Tax=Ensifer aridi TaxID=1708715 RepID=UPI000A101187|nr:sn-glycerol-3-phosphate ABC transporter ATP-binding protein UgpC [Ensifer aridi]